MTGKSSEPIRKVRFKNLLSRQINHPMKKR